MGCEMKPKENSYRLVSWLCRRPNSLWVCAQICRKIQERTWSCRGHFRNGEISIARVCAGKFVDTNSSRWPVLTAQICAKQRFRCNLLRAPIRAGRYRDESKSEEGTDS